MEERVRELEGEITRCRDETEWVESRGKGATRAEAEKAVGLHDIHKLAVRLRKERGGIRQAPRLGGSGDPGSLHAPPLVTAPRVSGPATGARARPGKYHADWRHEADVQQDEDLRDVPYPPELGVWGDAVLMPVPLGHNLAPRPRDPCQRKRDCKHLLPLLRPPLRRRASSAFQIAAVRAGSAPRPLGKGACVARGHCKRSKRRAPTPRGLGFRWGARRGSQSLSWPAS